MSRKRFDRVCLATVFAVGVSITFWMPSCVNRALAVITDTTVQTTSALGNGSNTSFAIGFTFFDNDHLNVYLQDETTTPYTRTRLYEGGGVSQYQTGSDSACATPADPATYICMGTAPAATERVIIKRNTPRTQTVDYDDDRPYPADDQEDQLDKFVMVVQEQQAELDSKIGLSVGSTSTTPTFPEPVANGVVHYNAAAGDLTLTASTTEGNILRVSSGAWSDSADLTTEETTTAAHRANVSNPHTVTATQVGKDTAQWNADEIQGVTVDDSAIADGYGLLYDSASGNLVYSNVPANGVPGVLGSAYQTLRVDSGATGLEYVDLQGTTNQITITDNAGNTTLSTPQDIDTGASVQFASVQLSSGTSTIYSTDALAMGTASGAISLTPGGNAAAAVVAGSLQLTLNGGQQYIVSNNATDTNHLVVQGQTSGQPATLSLFSKDSDGTDSNRLRVYGSGAPTDAAYHYLDMGWASGGYYAIQTTGSAGNNKNLLIGSDGQIGQLTLMANGRIGMENQAPEARFHVEGDDDEVQLLVEGYTTQTNPLQQWKTGASVVQASMSNSGVLTLSQVALEQSAGLSTVTLGTSTTASESYNVYFPAAAPTTADEAMVWDGTKYVWQVVTGPGSNPTFDEVTISNSINGGTLILAEDTDNGTSTVSIKAPDAMISGSYTITLPATGPATGDSVMLFRDGGTGEYEWKTSKKSLYWAQDYGGYGSSFTKVPYFDAVVANVDNGDWTAVNNSTYGLYFDIIKPGVYSSTCALGFTASAKTFGTVVNGDGTTAFSATGASSRIGEGYSYAANTNLTVTTVKYFAQHDRVFPCYTEAADTVYDSRTFAFFQKVSD